MKLELFNPHSILAAIESRPADVLELILPEKASMADPWKTIFHRAEKNQIHIRQEAQARAVVLSRVPILLEELFSKVNKARVGDGLWIALDQLQDPHNVGAVFRTAAFFGVRGMILTQDRSSPLSATVYDVASGGVEYVPFTICNNFQSVFKIAKNSGLWVLGASEHAELQLSSIANDRPWLLVFGNEEKGMRRLTEESCDLVCRIPSHGQITSLNVSVAVGGVLSHFTYTAAHN